MNTFTLGACFQHELHTGPHLLPDYIDDLGTSPSIPKRDFFLHKSSLSSESFSHFIRVISLPLTECNNITLPKLARKRNKLPDTLSQI